MRCQSALPMLWILLLLIVLSGQPSQAQVVETGRWQSLHYPAAAVHMEAERRFYEMLHTMAEAGALNNDRRQLYRVRRISHDLIQAAAQYRPEILHWEWEVHLSDVPQVEALSMAGGKILVGSRFIQDLKLSDGELATLLGHEIAHVIAEHQREELSEARLQNRTPGDDLDLMWERLESDLSLQIRLAWLSAIQEQEADHLGMVITHQTGWPGETMVGFYQKLAALGGQGLIARAYPATDKRVSMARGFAKLWQVADGKHPGGEQIETDTEIAALKRGLAQVLAVADVQYQP